MTTKANLLAGKYTFSCLAEYFPSMEVHKYRLKDTVWVERHHKDVLSRHW